MTRDEAKKLLEEAFPVGYNYFMICVATGENGYLDTIVHSDLTLHQLKAIVAFMEAE